MYTFLDWCFVVLIWLVVLEGLACAAFPQLVMKFSNWLLKTPERVRGIGIVELCIGCGILALFYWEHL